MAIDYYSKEIGGSQDYYSQEIGTQRPAPFTGPVSKFAFPTAGGIVGGMGAGALMGTAVEPGLGTLIGGGLGAFLGATGADVGRKYLSAELGHQPAPDFLKTVGQTVLEQAPMIPFGAASEAAGMGLRAAAPALENAPRFLQAFTRGGTVANTATRSAAGGLAGGTTQGLLQGKSLPQAVQQGVQQAPQAALLGGAIQAVPNVGRYMGGNEAAIKAAEVPPYTEGDRLVQAMRGGNLPDYLSKRGHAIFEESVKQPIVANATPRPLRDYYDAMVNAHGEDSPQVNTLLKAFGEKGVPGEASSSELSRLGMSSEELQNLQRMHPGQIDISLSGRGGEAASFERPVSPQEALDVASRVSGKVKGGATSGYKRGFSFQDSVNSDVRAGIYDVLKSNLSEESRRGVEAGLQRYGEFATLRNRVIATVSPYGNVNTPTAPGIQFLHRLASGETTAQTPDDIRLANFIQEALGQPATPTGREITGKLPKLFQELERAKQYGRQGKYEGRTARRIGIQYPIFRSIRKMFSGGK